MILGHFLRVFGAYLVAMELSVPRVQRPPLLPLLASDLSLTVFLSLTVRLLLLSLSRPLLYLPITLSSLFTKVAQLA